jgi:hypothetical protein
MPMPLWLAEAFCERYLSWRLFQSKTLDEAVKVERPKSTHISTRARHIRLHPRVVLEIQRLLRVKRVPIDEALFAEVGKNLGISRTLASKVYYDPTNPWRQMFLDMVADEKVLRAETVFGEIDGAEDFAP